MVWVSMAIWPSSGCACNSREILAFETRGDFALSGDLRGMARSGQWLDQALARGLRGRRRPGGLAELVADVGDVAVDGVRAEVEALGDLTVAEPVGDVPQDLD